MGRTVGCHVGPAVQEHDRHSIDHRAVLLPAYQTVPADVVSTYEIVEIVVLAN